MGVPAITDDPDDDGAHIIDETWGRVIMVEKIINGEHAYTLDHHHVVEQLDAE